MKDEIFHNIDKEILSKLSKEGSGFLDSFLEEQGYDLDEIQKVSLKAFKQQSFLIKGELNHEKDKRLLEKASDQLRIAISENLDKPVAYLKRLILENKLGVQYRNLEKLSIDDIKEIIKDQNLLELLELLDKKDEDE